MSWLRLDDKFGSHPKVLELSDREFRAHVLALCYCAEYRTDGSVPRVAWRTLGVTQKIADRFVSLGIWDENSKNFSIHDWKIYNGNTIEERVFAYLERHPEASSNDVQRAVGGKRELVLDSIRRFRSGSQAGSLPGSPEPDMGGSQSGSLFGSQSVLSQTQGTSTKAVASKADAEIAPPFLYGPGVNEIQELEAATVAKLRSI